MSGRGHGSDVVALGPRKGFSYLTGDPLGRRIGGHAGPDQFPFDQLPRPDGMARSGGGSSDYPPVRGANTGAIRDFPQNRPSMGLAAQP